MADSIARLAAKPPPTRSVAHRQIAFGALLVLFAAAAAASSVGGGGVLTGASCLIFGVFLLYTGVLLRLSGDAVSTLNTAYNAALEGRVEDAERLLDAAEGRYQLGYPCQTSCSSAGAPRHKNTQTTPACGENAPAPGSW